ncbi:hypothetical protein [Serratia sp. D1N4]
MTKYRVTIEAPGYVSTHYFEAATTEDAEEIGSDIFHEYCNYGVSRVADDDETDRFVDQVCGDKPADHQQ